MMWESPIRRRRTDYGEGDTEPLPPVDTSLSRDNESPGDNRSHEAPPSGIDNQLPLRSIDHCTSPNIITCSTADSSPVSLNIDADDDLWVVDAYPHSPRIVSIPPAPPLMGSTIQMVGCFGSLFKLILAALISIGSMSVILRCISPIVAATYKCLLCRFESQPMIKIVNNTMTIFNLFMRTFLTMISLASNACGNADDASAPVINDHVRLMRRGAIILFC